MMNHISAEVRWLFGYFTLQRLAASGSVTPQQMLENNKIEYQDLLYRRREFLRKAAAYYKHQIKSSQETIDALRFLKKSGSTNLLEDLKSNQARVKEISNTRNEYQKIYRQLSKDGSIPDSDDKILEIESKLGSLDEEMDGLYQTQEIIKKALKIKDVSGSGSIDTQISAEETKLKSLQQLLDNNAKILLDKFGISIDNVSASTEFDPKSWTTTDNSSMVALGNSLRSALGQSEFNALPPRAKASEKSKDKDQDDVEKFSKSKAEAVGIKTARMLGEAAIKLMNLMYGVEIPLSRSAEWGRKALYAAADKRGGNMSLEDVVQQIHAKIVSSLAKNPKYKIDERITDPKSNVSRLLGTYINFIKREAITENTRGNVAEDSLELYAYLKYVDQAHKEDPESNPPLKAKQQSKYRALEKKYKEQGIDLSKVEPIPFMPKRRQLLQDMSVLSRGGEGGEEIEWGEQNIPEDFDRAVDSSSPEGAMVDAEFTVPIMRILNPTDPVSLYSHLMYLSEAGLSTRDDEKKLAQMERELVAEYGAEFVENITPKQNLGLIGRLKSEISKYVKDPIQKVVYDSLYKTIFEKGLGDLGANQKENDKLLKNIKETIKEEIETKKNFKFMKSGTDAVDLYKYKQFELLNASDPKDISKIQSELKKLRKNLVAQGYDLSLPAYGPSDIKPSSVDEFEELLKTKVVPRNQATLSIDWSDVSDEIAAAKLMQGDGAKTRIDKISDHLLKLINGLVTAEQKRELRKLYFEGEEAVGKSIDKRKKHDDFLEQRRKDYNSFKTRFDEFSASPDTAKYKKYLDDLEEVVKDSTVSDENKTKILNAIPKIKDLSISEKDFIQFKSNVINSKRHLPPEALELVDILTNKFSVGLNVSMRNLLEFVPSLEISPADKTQLKNSITAVLSNKATQPDLKRLIQQINKLYEKYPDSMPAGLKDALTEFKLNDFESIISDKTKFSLEDRLNHLLWSDSFRFLTVSEREELKELKAKFKDRALLPQGTPPDEGIDDEIIEYRKLKRMQSQGMLGMHGLIEYMAELEERFKKDPFNFDDIIIKSIDEWEKNLAPYDISMLQDRAKKAGKYTPEDSRIELPEEEKIKKFKGNMHSRLYSQLEWLDELGVLDYKKNESADGKNLYLLFTKVLPDVLKKTGININNIPPINESLKSKVRDHHSSRFDKWMSDQVKLYEDELSRLPEHDTSSFLPRVKTSSFAYYRYLQATRDRIAMIALKLAV